ncbi:MAG: hypothetical protein IT370_08585 [Deltaproteobacteria bacterium]|nr:hypothetical protein [Deltaproteobacteria bacterium]
MTQLLIGGLRSGHDQLVRAALAAEGLDARVLEPCDGAALAAGRAVLARGHCNPVYYLAGALVRSLQTAARDHGAEARAIAASHALVSVGSCGPCRFASYAGEYRRAAAAAGFAGLPVLSLEQTAPTPTPGLSAAGLHLGARTLARLTRALLLADVLEAAAGRARLDASDAAAVDGVVRQARAVLAHALAARAPLRPALGALRRQLAALPRRVPASGGAGRPRVRARITRELFAALSDGEPQHDVARWLERRDVDVTLPTVADWLLYPCWQARGPVGPRAVLARRAERLVTRLHRGAAAALGLPATLPDLDDLATLAAPHYAPALRGGMGHLEVATYLACARDASADLVVSIKPFGCLPSSALSDGVLPALARTRRPVWVALETTGDATAQLESRLELALDQARSRLAQGPARPGVSRSSQSSPPRARRSDTT